MPNPLSRLAAYRPCACGVRVLHGQTRDGVAVCLDPAQRTYVALWEPDPKAKDTAAHYIMAPSMAYPAHACRQHQLAGKD